MIYQLYNDDCHISHTVRCRYNAVNFITNIHKRHPMARPLGRGMGCLLWIQHLIDIMSQFLQLLMQNLTILDRVITALDCTLYTCDTSCYSLWNQCPFIDNIKHSLISWFKLVISHLSILDQATSQICWIYWWCISHLFPYNLITVPVIWFYCGTRFLVLTFIFIAEWIIMVKTATIDWNKELRLTAQKYFQTKLCNFEQISKLRILNIMTFLLK